jgi:hypothetical protein
MFLRNIEKEWYEVKVIVEQKEIAILWNKHSKIKCPSPLPPA